MCVLTYTKYPRSGETLCRIRGIHSDRAPGSDALMDFKLSNSTRSCPQRPTDMWRSPFDQGVNDLGRLSKTLPSFHMYLLYFYFLRVQWKPRVQSYEAKTWTNENGISQKSLYDTHTIKEFPR